MSSLKEISNMLIKIAYSDKNERPFMIKDLENSFDALPVIEIPKEQQILIASILNELEKESLIGIDINDLDSNKAVKTRTKKQKEVEILKPVIEDINVVEPNTVVINGKQRITRLSNLRRGDRFTFPLSQEDKDMGLSDLIYVFDSKSKTTFYYKSGDSEFSTSENREVNLLSNNEPEIINEEIIIEKPKVERKTIVKPEPKKEEDAFSFLDNIDDAF
jgi:hypothetical protein